MVHYLQIEVIPLVIQIEDLASFLGIYSNKWPADPASLLSINLDGIDKNDSFEGRI